MSSSNDNGRRRPSALKSFAAGACGGLTLVVASHPFDLVKVRLQTAPAGLPSGRPTAMAAARNIVAADGVLGLYRGVTPVLLGAPPVLAINFWAYYVCQGLVLAATGEGRAAQKPDPAAGSASRTPADTDRHVVDRLSLTQIGIAGALAAIPTSFLLGPSEQIKIRLQVQHSPTGSAFAFVDTIREIVREGGVRAIFRGTGSTLLRDIPGSFFYFATYEGLKRAFKRSDTDVLNPAAIMCAGGIAGMVNWTIAIPMDTIKSRLQSAKPQDASLRRVVASLLAEGGPSALFRGLGPTLLRAFPASAAFFFGVETSTRIMDRFF